MFCFGWALVTDEFWFKSFLCCILYHADLGSAESPFLYDKSWGGMVMCGCNYVYENGKGFCANKFPDCPALVDQGQNFGAGFYNDHHYHFGYHIYAAAVLSRYDRVWARRYYDHVMLLVRDIANPSTSDPYFPIFRHKDW
jgi:endo-1,3(4)-beta-glucanase